MMRVRPRLRNVRRVCQLQKTQQSEVHMWESAEWPWQSLHIDFAGHFHGKLRLLDGDAYAMYARVIQM